MRNGKGRHSVEVLPNTGEAKEPSTLMLAKTTRAKSPFKYHQKRVKIRTKKKPTHQQNSPPLLGGKYLPYKTLGEI